MTENRVSSYLQVLAGSGNLCWRKPLTFHPFHGLTLKQRLHLKTGDGNLKLLILDTERNDSSPEGKHLQNAFGSGPFECLGEGELEARCLQPAEKGG